MSRSQITIDAEGNVFVDDVPIGGEALGARLQQIAAGSREPGGPRIFLRADQGLDYARVMEVMGEISRAGFEAGRFGQHRAPGGALMDRAEATGAGVALVGHAALLVALTWGFAMTAAPPPTEQAMEVSFVDEIGLDLRVADSLAGAGGAGERARDRPDRGCRADAGAGARTSAAARGHPPGDAGAARRRVRSAPASAPAAPGSATSILPASAPIGPRPNRAAPRRR